MRKKRGREGGVKFLSAFDGIGSEYDKLALVLQYTVYTAYREYTVYTAYREPT